MHYLCVVCCRQDSGELCRRSKAGEPLSPVNDVYSFQNAVSAFEHSPVARNEDEDAALDRFLQEYKRNQKIAAAVTTIASYWRSKGPKNTFRRYNDITITQCVCIPVALPTRKKCPVCLFQIPYPKVQITEVSIGGNFSCLETALPSCVSVRDVGKDTNRA